MVSFKKRARPPQIMTDLVTRFPSFACGKNRLRSTAWSDLLSGSRCSPTDQMGDSLPFFCLRQKPAALNGMV
jgi:hypothetical protein